MKKQYAFENIRCHIGNIDFLQITRGKGYTIRFREGREKNGFIFVQSGAMRYTFLEGNAGEVLLGMGEMFFIPAGTAYEAIYLEDGTRAIVAQFDLLDGALPQGFSTPCSIQLYDAERQMRSLFEHPHPAPTEENRTFYCIFRMYELLWNAVNSRQETAARFLKLTPALQELRKHFAAQHKVDYYADLCVMSESGFRRLFREYTGLSPIEYRNRLRLEEARKLIGTGEYSVAEAADAVGFTNISFFCRSYKKLFGQTPLGHQAKDGV
ncbi:MAG: helix-turn-helix transcriptional regulator [Clostridia bacterium]|nr:helix-turn-helix transcriptional regulator [Clostridia bacterium]